MIKGQFAKNLHKAVSERGIKQVELAKVLEVPPTTVNGWMRGAHLPDIEKLMEICDYLEMPVGEMLGDHRHINDLDEVKHLMDVSLKQKAYIENLEAELNECKMLNNQLMSDLDADEGLAEICVNEFIADTIKAVKDAGRRLRLSFDKEKEPAFAGWLHPEDYSSLRFCSSLMR